MDDVIFGGKWNYGSTLSRGDYDEALGINEAIHLISYQMRNAALARRNLTRAINVGRFMIRQEELAIRIKFRQTHKNDKGGSE